MTQVAIVAGCRTPFVKAGGILSSASSLDLGVHVISELTKRIGVASEEIDELVFGTVLLDPRYPNLAREIVLRSGLPKTISAHFMSNNCISGLVAVGAVSEAIKSGRIRIGLAGGSESMSRPTLTLKPKAEDFFLKLARAKNFSTRLSTLLKFRPSFAMPQAPSPKEPSTGLTMGQHCELSAQEFSVSREQQDLIAYRSHKNAAAAQVNGHLSAEIVPFGDVRHDNLIRPDTNVEKLAKLGPVFERSSKGTITAGNSSALTDGASAICLMSKEIAEKKGLNILGFIDDIQYSAIDPSHGLLMAPAIALPKLMKKNGLSVDAVDLFEIHEAFGAQVAANLHVWEKGWNKYQDISPIGNIPSDKINVNGGSIAIGHPFAATGGRLILSLLNELNRRKKRTGVISVCAAGAMAAAVLVRVP